MSPQTDPTILSYVQRAAPSVPPNAQLAIASGASDASDAIDTAQSIQAYGAASSQVNHLNQLDTDHQRHIWQTASPDLQQMWSSAGYSVPHKNRSFLSRALHDVVGAPAAVFRQAEHVPVLGDVIHGGEEALGTVGEAGGAALNALGAGGRFVQHLYRTGAEVNAENNISRNSLTDSASALVGAASLGATYLHLTDKNDWSDAWDKTSRGDQTFDPNRARDIKRESGYDDLTDAFARAAAGSREDIVGFLKAQKDAGMSAEDVAKLQGKLDEPAFKDVVTQYKDAKMSFGRALVPQWMWDHAHPAATIVSGMGDALFSFVDPLIVGAKVNKAYKVAKYGFKSVEEMATVLQKPAARDWMKDVAGYLKNEDYAGLLHRHSQLAPTLTAIARDKVKTAEQLAASAGGDEASTKALQEAMAWQDKMEQTASDIGRLPQQGVIGKTGLGREVHETPTIDSTTKQELKIALDQVGLAQADTEEKVAKWMEANVLHMHILSGRGTASNHGVQMVPTLTKAGKAALDAKGAMRNAIDWAADVKFDVGENGAQSIAGKALSGPVNLVGTTAKRMTTLIPQGGYINPEDPNAVVAIQRFARAYLPAHVADDLVNKWAMAPDNGARRGIYMDMLGQTFKAAGIDMSDDSRLMQHFLDTAERHQVRQMYSIDGNDQMRNVSGLVESNGLLEKHLTTKWDLPSFKELSANANRHRAMSLLYGTANNPLTYQFSRYWKPLQLLRVGFPLRVSMEEFTGGMLRNGPIAMAKAALAGRKMAGEFGMSGPLADLNPIEAGVSRLLRELPENVRNKVTDDPNALLAKVFAHRTERFMKATSGKVAGVDELTNTAHEYHELFEGGLVGDISSRHGASLSVHNDPEAEANSLANGLTRYRAEVKSNVKPSGDYKAYEADDTGFLSTWMSMLDDMAGSGAARHVLKAMRGDVRTGSKSMTLPANFEPPSEEALRAWTAAYLRSPGFAKHWQEAARSKKLSDGRVVGLDATPDDAAMDWADKLIYHVKTLTQTPEGELHNDLIDHMLDNGKAPDMRALRKIAKDQRPKQVVGPEFIDLPPGGTPGLLNEFITHGFARIGTAIDYMARQPLYLTAVHKADKDLRPLIESQFGEGTKMTKDLLHTLVKQRADAETLPYIHNPAIRSQMNIITTNLAPFQFAQEQFWKRWTRTFIHSPEAMREAQLAHHALGATGLTHKDESGNETFVYPLTGVAQQVVAEGFQAMGIPASLPVSQIFTGNVKMVAPGLDRTFAPSWGPLVAVPLNLVARQFHELQPLEHKVLGELGSDKPLWEMVVPVTVARVVNAAIANDQISPSYANAQMRAMQDMYATGNGLPTDATAYEREEFMRKVKNWTRINMFLRALVGFNVPAAPSSLIGDTQIGQQMRQLSDAGLTFPEAVQSIMKENPNAFPYTVFNSVGAGKQPLPATKDSAAMLEQYRGFFEANKEAGGYFLPAKSSDAKFDQQAYKEQLLEELRIRRTPQEYLEQLMYTQAAGDYYDTRDDYQEQVKGVSGQAKQQLDNVYATWKQGYLKEHPVFADKLQAATAVIDRSRTLSSLRIALNDSSAPPTPQTEAMRDVVDTYDDYKSRMNRLAGLNSAAVSQQRKFETQRFTLMMKDYLEEHPEGLDVYNSLIRPEVETN
jgi:hypothetical protein